MRLQTGLAAAAVGLAFACPASAAAIQSTKAICEITPGGVLTIQVHEALPVILEYHFQTLPSGVNYFFAANTQSDHRKFALPPGNYKLSVKMPAYPTIDTYGPVVAVKDFTVVNGACVFSKPRDAAEPAHKASQ